MSDKSGSGAIPLCSDATRIPGSTGEEGIFAHAINELQVALDIARNNHRVALLEHDYKRAGFCYERERSMTTAINTLRNVEDIAWKVKK